MRDHECAQAFHRQVFTILLTSVTLTGLYFWNHSDVCSFDIEHEFLTLSVAHDDAHTLGL